MAVSPSLLEAGNNYFKQKAASNAFEKTFLLVGFYVRYSRNSQHLPISQRQVENDQKDRLMVAYNKDENLKKPAVILVPLKQDKSGIVCPKCYHNLRECEFDLLPENKDRYNRITRVYLGFHIECDTGFEVVQFKQGNLWIIHKFRYFDDDIMALGKCQLINPLPEPAPVVTGQGGNTDSPYTPEVIKLMETVLTTQKALTKTVESLLKLAKGGK